MAHGSKAIYLESSSTIHIHPSNQLWFIRCSFIQPPNWDLRCWRSPSAAIPDTGELAAVSKKAVQELLGGLSKPSAATTSKSSKRPTVQYS